MNRPIQVLTMLFFALSFLAACNMVQVSQTGRPLLILKTPDISLNQRSFDIHLNAFQRCSTEAVALKNYRLENFTPFDDQFRLTYHKAVPDSFRAELGLVSLLAPIPVERFQLNVPGAGMYKLIQIDVQPRTREIRATASLFLVDVDRSKRILDGWDFSAGQTARRDGAKLLDDIETCFRGRV